MGLGFDYHLLTDKFDVRRINANFQKLENVGLVNPNLLINWDWETPVNQRNATGAVSNAYCIDRWNGNGTVTPSAGNHVALGNGTTMIQRMDILPAKLYGKTVTASVDIDGTIQSATLTFPSSGSGAATSQALTGVTVEIAFIDLGSGNTTPLENVASRYIPYVKFTATAAINVRRVKLELGTVTTLAQSAPERYADVLKTCQRYYRVFTEVAFIVATTSYCTMNLQYDMRKDAALTIQQFLSGDHTPNTATLVTTTAASTNLTVILVQNANTDVRYAQYVRLNAEL